MKNTFLPIVGTCSGKKSKRKIQAELEELRDHPSRYRKDIVEVIQFESARALGIAIETHSITENANGNYIDSIERYNEGCQHTARLMWDRQGEHYILIKQMEGEQAPRDGAAYTESLHNEGWRNGRKR